MWISICFVMLEFHSFYNMPWKLFLSPLNDKVMYM
jgi:hypothetical protein